jgi:DNA-binding PadR family transcriptional regulator
MTNPRMTLATQRVLRVLVNDPDGQHYGTALMAETGLRSGSLYPILTRLEDAGWITGEWEDVDEHVVGRPRRRYYTLTANGGRAATAALEETLRNLTPERWRPRLTRGGARWAT